ncbi:ISAs1 family transposase [Aquimarina sp. 2201CG1-2-11]|uniref:ISAs1 family transposase n=1 Tax=Aquimarina discodermiae TaxID=3231043 RepID=UPI003461FD80
MLIFGEYEIDWLKKHGSFCNGFPSKDTLRRFFYGIRPIEFSTLFSKLVDSLRDTNTLEIIALDGKTVHSAKNLSVPQSITPHIVNAMATDQGLSLGQSKVIDKSNEISAITELLDILFIEKSIVTIDAIGCQKAIVGQIKSKNTNYIIAAIANQGTLHLAIKDTLQLEKPTEIVEQNDCGHRRVEKRTCKIYTNLSHLENAQEWKDLKSFIVIEKEVYHKSTHKTTNETHFYISNLTTDATVINNAIRKHWSIENQLHRLLDVVFNQDTARKRVQNSAENFNIILKAALNLINKETTLKKSKNNKRFKALIDKEYREKVLCF